jgi:hypothetical protein
MRLTLDRLGVDRDAELLEALPRREATAVERLAGFMSGATSDVEMAS